MGGSYTFTTWRYNLAIHATIIGGVACSLGLSTGEAQVRGGFLLLVLVTAALFNVATVARRRATLAVLAEREEELRQARASLEGRVQARTNDLMREVAERRDAEHRANAASQAKNRFLANMSHELRTPLNAVIGYAEILAEDLEDQGDEVKRDLGHILGSARQLLRMINDILDLARVESGDWDVLDETVHVDQLVAEVAAAIAPLADHHENAIQTIVLDMPPLVTDATRLRQILMSLMSNAARFTAEGRICLTVHRVWQEPRWWLEAEVEDTGVGIPPDQLERVFDKFVQLDNSATRRHDGAGLGLALSRELALVLGGTLVVESEVGVGSRFTLRIPWRGVGQPTAAPTVSPANGARTALTYA